MIDHSRIRKKKKDEKENPREKKQNVIKEHYRTEIVNNNKKVFI